MRIRIILLYACVLLFVIADTYAQSAIDGFKPDVNGIVTDIEIGPTGHKYICGVFTQVNGTPRSNLARLNHNGSLDTSWVPAPNGSIQSIAVIGTKVLVVGGFNSIGGAPSNGIALLNANGTNGLHAVMRPRLLINL